ncbi:AMP-binding protein [Stappia sp. MMSF_3263]|uniref:AMP-binding protein n=1 Tax=Stappia sp. MMSF_3263 TaxID=3046693 RepID=UPI00273D598A|nr:AMP-binding protein [Stappia sp. MMSF_3263]
MREPRGDTVCASLEAYAKRAGGGTALCDGRETLTWHDVLVRTQAAETALAQARAGRLMRVDAGDPLSGLLHLCAGARSGRTVLVADPVHWQRHGERLRAQFGPFAETASCLVAGEGPRDPDEASERPEVRFRPGPTQPFYIGLTSGSTGMPKAFQRSHRSWTASFRLCLDTFGIEEADRIFVPGGIGHSLHLFGAVLALDSGLRLDIARRFQPKAILRRMHKAGSSVLVATPTQLQLLARGAASEGIHLPDLRRVLLSGAKWRDSERELLARMCPGAEVHEFYGTSETSFISHRVAGDPPGSVGRPFKGVEVEIRGAAGDRLADGESGDIWVRSGLLFDGYVMGTEPMTRRDGGWISVGDRGHLDGDGHLWLSGRKGRMIVTSGINVFAEEIEAALLRHPDVGQAAVFGLEDPLRGARIVAAIQPNGSSLPDPRALHRHCLALLEPAKVPRAFQFLSHWPLTPGGKSDLSAIAAQIEHRGTAHDGVSRRAPA